MKAKLFKTIEYCYPTSISACKGGYGKTGCYIYYEVREVGDLKRKNVKYFLYQTEAINYAKKQPLEFTWLFLKYNPLFVQAN